MPEPVVVEADSTAENDEQSDEEEQFEDARSTEQDEPAKIGNDCMIEWKACLIEIMFNFVPGSVPTKTGESQVSWHKSRFRGSTKK